MYDFYKWDTAGSDRYRSISESIYRHSHAIIIVFDLAEEVRINFNGTNRSYLK